MDELEARYSYRWDIPKDKRNQAIFHNVQVLLPNKKIN